MAGLLRSSISGRHACERKRKQSIQYNVVVVVVVVFVVVAAVVVVVAVIIIIIFRKPEKYHYIQTINIPSS